MGFAARYAWLARAFRVWNVAAMQEEEPFGGGSDISAVFGVAGSVKAYVRQAANVDFLQAVALVRLQLLILVLFWLYSSAKSRALSGNPGAFSSIPCQTAFSALILSNLLSDRAFLGPGIPHPQCHSDHLPTVPKTRTARTESSHTA